MNQYTEHFFSANSFFMTAVLLIKIPCYVQEVKKSKMFHALILELCKKRGSCRKLFLVIVMKQNHPRTLLFFNLWVVLLETMKIRVGGTLSLFEFQEINKNELPFTIDNKTKYKRALLGCISVNILRDSQNICFQWLRNIMKLYILAIIFPVVLKLVDITLFRKNWDLQ